MDKVDPAASNELLDPSWKPSEAHVLHLTVLQQYCNRMSTLRYAADNRRLRNTGRMKES